MRFIFEVLRNITTFLLSSCCENLIKAVIEEILSWFVKQFKNLTFYDILH